MLQAVSFPQTGSDSTRHFLYQRFRDVKYLLLVNVRSLIPSTRYVKNMDTSSQPIHLPIEQVRLVICLAPGADFARRAATSFRRQGTLSGSPFLGTWLPVGDLCETPSPLTGKVGMGVENALKASNRDRRLAPSHRPHRESGRTPASSRSSGCDRRANRPVYAMRRTRQHPRLLRALPSARGPTKWKRKTGSSTATVEAPWLATASR